MDKNMLFYGDNLDIMRKYIADNSVDLCYIDPPFNSKRDYNQIYNNIGKEDKAQSVAFVDTWEWNEIAEKEYDEFCLNQGGIFTKRMSDSIEGFFKILGRGSLMSYLISMTLRINEIHRVLKPTGSFYLHCDPTVSHYLKIVLDAIFCGQGGEFRNEIVWSYKTTLKILKQHFGKDHDTVFFYTKGKESVFHPDRNDFPISQSTVKRWGKYADETGFVSNIHYSPSLKRIIDTSDESKGFYINHGIPRDVWDISVITGGNKENMGYPTQKPIALLERIIKASSNEGDVVLDAFCGGGTTVVAAQKLGRKWIGIDITYKSILLIKERLAKLCGEAFIDSIEVNGIPRDIESAKELANKENDRLRKEFEKWAVLAYSNNKAMANDKKGGDHGIDGILRIAEEKNKFRDVLFSVKSGKVNPGMIRDFRGVIEREKAAAGIFITLEPPTKGMKQEAVAAGFYGNKHLKIGDIPKIEIVTAEQIIKGERAKVLPIAADIFNNAQEAFICDNQISLFDKEQDE